MFGLDHAVAGLSSGGALLVVLAISLLLGLRHATDPDHLAAVTTLAAGRGMAGRSAGRLGLAWGAGHATSLFALGLPIVLWRAYLPHRLQEGAEALVGVLIVALALWLLARALAGTLRTRARIRSHATAYGIGVVHGVGGSAGIGILLLAAIPARSVALAGLGLFAVGTALSMGVLSAGFGRVLSHAWAVRAAPALAVVSLVFGVWYTAAALGI
jgi:High-affinity nickel-transport protein